MHRPAFLFALCLLAILAFPTSLSHPRAVHSSSRLPLTVNDESYNSSRMWRRAEIRVTPLEQADLNRAKLETLRRRVAAAETESAGFWFSDPALRNQLLAQLQLMKELLDFAAQEQSGRPNSPTAIQVQRRLNQIQGQTMCEACHNGIVAESEAHGLQHKSRP
jgi:hypothetical protein